MKVVRKKKKKVIKKKNILVFLISLIGICVLFYYIITMPIHNIYIKNNKIVTDNEIIKISGLDSYPSFILTKSSDIKKKIKKNKYIDKVKIKKEFGNIITIYIKEYQVIATTKEDKLILSNGLQIDNTYELSDMPILINEIQEKEIYTNFAKKMGKVKKDILRQISEIEYSPVEVDKNRFLLYMSDSNLVYITLTKINKLNKYNRIKDKLEGKIGTIYLDAGNYVELRKNNENEQ